MVNFLGGSAYAMARDIGDGYHAVTERTFRGMNRAELDQLAFELDRHLRETRGEAIPLDDLPRVQHRNRKIQRLNSALVTLRAFRSKRRE